MKGEKQKAEIWKAEIRKTDSRTTDHGQQTAGPGNEGSVPTEQPARGRALDDGSNEMLTKEELAAKLKVTVRTVENWQHDGFLPGVKIANVVRFHWPEVVEHLKANFKIGGGKG